MRIHAPLLRSREGQFIPLVSMLILTSIVLLFTVTNIYRVSRAKLQTQNLADATALAIAAMQAKSINTIIDRNEWLNNLYPVGTPHNQNTLPGLSEAANGTADLGGRNNKMPDDEARNYAQLVYAVNKSQMMFKQAYNNFLGASADGMGDVQTQNSGFGSLAEILSEIDGLTDPNVVQVIVYNNRDGAQAVDRQANQFIQAQNNQNLNSGQGGSKLQVAGKMQPVPFLTEDIWLETKKSGRKSLSQLLQIQDPKMKAGWMRPDWDDEKAALEVKTANNNTEKRIGVGALVIKKVPMSLFFKDVYVQAKSTAYVVKESGFSMDKATHKAPVHFGPTYYVQLGYR